MAQVTLLIKVSKGLNNVVKKNKSIYKNIVHNGKKFGTWLPCP